MHFRILIRLALFTTCAHLSLLAAEPCYESRAEHDPDGIGKFYAGREIAHVMGHQAADWLERPEREEEERTDLLIAALKLEPGQTVADIGAGSGYFSWRMARVVGKSGRVYAVDIQPEMLELLRQKMKKQGVEKIVQPVLGTVRDPKLPSNSVDLVLLVDVYHEFDFPYEMTQKLVSALKPGGQLVFVEYRAEDSAIPIKPLHKMSEPQVRKEMLEQPLDFVENVADLPRQHVLIFRKQE